MPSVYFLSFWQKKKIDTKTGSSVQCHSRYYTWKKTAQKTETPIKLPSTVLHRKTACWWITPTFNVSSLLIPLGIVDTFQAMLFRCKFKQLAFVFSLCVHWEMRNLSRITMESFGAFFLLLFKTSIIFSFPTSHQMLAYLWDSYKALYRNWNKTLTH